MPRVFEGDLSASGLRFAIVASRFNDDIVSKLLEGAVECLERHGAAEGDIAVYRVPGAFEIPSMVAHLAALGNVDGIVTIGALIKGETPHFEFISTQVTQHISRVSIDTGIPATLGVITCNTLEQARDRCRKGNNKGWEAALAAIEMVNLFRLAAGEKPQAEPARPE